MQMLAVGTEASCYCQSICELEQISDGIKVKFISTRWQPTIAHMIRGTLVDIHHSFLLIVESDSRSICSLSSRGSSFITKQQGVGGGEGSGVVVLQRTRVRVRVRRKPAT